MARTLGLDLSFSSTGFAFGDEESPRPQGGVWKMPMGPHNFDRALHMFGLELSTLIRFEKITHVFIEAAWQAIDEDHSAYVNRLQLSLSAVAHERCYTNGAHFVEDVDCRHWRKSTLGTAFPDNPKQKAMDRCDELGWTYAAHDEAEAKLVWLHGMKRQQHPYWMPGRPQAIRSA